MDARKPSAALLAAVLLLAASGPAAASSYHPASEPATSVLAFFFFFRARSWCRWFLGADWYRLVGRGRRRAPHQRGVGGGEEALVPQIDRQEG